MTEEVNGLKNAKFITLPLVLEIMCDIIFTNVQLMTPK